MDIVRIVDVLARNHPASASSKIETNPAYVYIKGTHAGYPENLIVVASHTKKVIKLLLWCRLSSVDITRHVQEAAARLAHVLCRYKDSRKRVLLVMFAKGTSKAYE